eukprot:gene11820-13044_t
MSEVLLQQRVVCQQCSEAQLSTDTKPTYDEEGEICGHICNPCRLKSAENARRCHIVDCKSKPDSGPTGFRTLPSKFYDLPEGEVKKRIVKQFGIIRNSRVCCNMCYVRISKAIVQTNIVYGGGLLSSRQHQDNKLGLQKSGTTGKQRYPSQATESSDNNNTTSSTATTLLQVKDNRLNEYTGPKFTRRMGGCWNKNRFVAAAESINNKNSSDLENQSVILEDNKDCSLLNIATSEQRASTVQARDDDNETELKKKNVLSKPAGDGNNGKEKHGDNHNDDYDDDNEDKNVITTMPASGDDNPTATNQVLMDVKLQIDAHTGVKQEIGAKEAMVQGSSEESPQKSVSYSSIPISPTLVRFRRIQPKLQRYESFELSDELADESDELMTPEKRGKRGAPEDGDFTWSPGGGNCKKEKLDGRNKKLKKSISSEVMSDFVSCMGCRKICSSKEAQPVYDSKKSFRGRLCNDCREKKGEQSNTCPLKGCSGITSAESDLLLKPLPEKIHSVKGEAGEKIKELGVTDVVESCCESCWDTLSAIMCSENAEKVESETTKQVFTTCRNCSRIVPIKDTVPNYEEDGRNCGVLCEGCFVMHPSGGDAEKKQCEMRRQRRSRNDMVSPIFKTFGLCKVKGCVNTKQQVPVQLVSGRKILRNYLDEKMLRSEFELDDYTDYCCRSCLARIKWFVADIQKKQAGISTDGKPVNSLKNLTSKLGQEPVDKLTGVNTKFVTAQENAHPKNASNQVQMIGAEKKLPVKKKARANNKPLQSKSIQMHSAEQPEALQDPNTLFVPSSALSSLSPAAFVIPPSTSTSTVVNPVNPPSSHPPVLQVGGQQFVLNVISRCDKEIQTSNPADLQQKSILVSAEKGVQANIPVMPKLEGTAPANLPLCKKVKYSDAKEKTRYAVKRLGKDLFEQFLEQLNEISGGCGQQLLLDIYRPKEVAMASNYEKILTSIGMLYRNTDRANKQERLRLLSTVALHASNETLKRFFQRKSKKGDLVSVNEAEVVQAREYAKQFGPGAHVMPVGQVSWRNVVANIQEKTAEDIEDFNESNSHKNDVDSSNSDQQVDMSPENEAKDASNPPDKQYANGASTFHANGTEGGVGDWKDVDKVENGSEKVANGNSAQQHTQKGALRRRRRTTCNTSVAGKVEGREVTTKRKRKLSLDSAFGGKETRKSNGDAKSTSAIITSDRDMASGAGGGGVREKRKRTAYSNEKKDILERYFQKSIYATKSMVLEITKEVGLDKKKIDNWFRNRRSKLKKDELDKQQPTATTASVVATKYVLDGDGTVVAAASEVKTLTASPDRSLPAPGGLLSEEVSGSTSDAAGGGDGSNGNDVHATMNDGGDGKETVGVMDGHAASEYAKDVAGKEVEKAAVDEKESFANGRGQENPEESRVNAKNDKVQESALMSLQQGSKTRFSPRQSRVKGRKKEDVVKDNKSSDVVEQQSRSSPRNRTPKRRSLETPPEKDITPVMDYSKERGPESQNEATSHDDEAMTDGLVDEDNAMELASEHGSLVIAENSDRELNSDDEQVVAATNATV